MVNRNKFNWRKSYYDEFVAQLKVSGFNSRDTSIPNELTLPVSARLSMCEFGGSKASSGTAVLIATPSGFPNAAIPVDGRKSNGVHLVSRVWIGSLVCIATHNFGMVTLGVYKICEFLKPMKVEASEVYARCELVVGTQRVTSSEVCDLRWLAPFDRKLKGLRRLVKATLSKLDMFECTTPVYLEPLRALKKFTGKDPDLLRLIQSDICTSPPVGFGLVPLYNHLVAKDRVVIDYTSFVSFEKAMMDACKTYYISLPHVFVLLCHHEALSYDSSVELQTHAFVFATEGKGKPLLHHGMCFKYIHTCSQGGLSIDMEGHVKSNYNESYIDSLLGFRGGTSKIRERIKSSQDGCFYVPMKYSMCTRPYNKP